MAQYKTFEHWLQGRLTSHGFPCGVIDGIVGPLTTAAIKAFQQAHRLEMTGMADAATVRALRAEPRPATPADMAAIPDRDEEPAIVKPAGTSLWPRQKDVPKFYGSVGKNITQIEVPFDMFLAWSKSHRIRKISVHKKVAKSAEWCFHQIEKTYSAKERSYIGIDLFGGSLNVRKMRGGSSWSMHSWAIAIDFDPERNQLRMKANEARLAKPDAVPFWEIWESEGWVSLGRTRNFDWMHVQAARL